MTHEYYLNTDKWFAWYPVRSTNEGWVWWCVTERTVDERPRVYLGLLGSKTYVKL